MVQNCKIIIKPSIIKNFLEGKFLSYKKNVGVLCVYAKGIERLL